MPKNQENSDQKNKFDHSKLKQAFDELTNLMIEVSYLVSIQIDQYIRDIIPTYPNSLEKILKNGNHVGQICHMKQFPKPKENNIHKNSHSHLLQREIWTPWHRDYNAITSKYYIIIIIKKKLIIFIIIIKKKPFARPSTPTLSSTP